MLTRNLRGLRKKMIASYLSIAVAFLIAIGTVISIFENRYRQNLLVDKSFYKFRRLKVEKLELKRYIKNTYLGSNLRVNPSNSKKIEVPLNSSRQDSMGMFNIIENELTVFAIRNNQSHEVFTCPYSEENVKTLLEIAKEFNIST